MLTKLDRRDMINIDRMKCLQNLIQGNQLKSQTDFEWIFEGRPSISLSLHGK